MNDQHISIAKRLHCLDIDRKRTGILILEDGRTELHFIGYEKFVYVRADESTYVVTEEGKVVSLHNNVPGRHSSTSVATMFGGKDRGRENNEYRTISHSGIISNLTVIGTDAWRSDHLIRRLTFNIDHTENILRHDEKVQSLGRASFPSEDDLSLYRVEAGNLTLTAGYTAKYNIYTQSLTAYRPTFSIEFKTGIALNAFKSPLLLYLTFLSFVLGGRMSPTNVRIDRLSFDEMQRAVEAGTYVGDHEVVSSRTADRHEAKDLAFHSAPFLAQDDDELAAFEDGLTAWVNRSNEWEPAYIRMTESVGLRRIISGERLIDAWRWFEELPNAGAERVLDNDAIEPMIQAALDAANQKKYSISNDRIRGSLKRIGEERMRDRFARLIGSVQEKFGRDCLSDGMIDHLESARKFRGRVAHGHFAPKSENELQRFHKATLAMESLCFLLTARDLPMADAGRHRILSHPLLEDYSLASFN